MRGVRGGEILRTNGEEFAVFQRERDSVLCTRPHIMSLIIISTVKSNKMLIRRCTQLQEMDMVNFVTKLLKEGMVIIVIVGVVHIQSAFMVTHHFGTHVLQYV